MELGAQDGGHREHCARFGGKAAEARRHDLAHSFRARHVTQGKFDPPVPSLIDDVTGVGEVAPQFTHEKRVPAGLGDE